MPKVADVVRKLWIDESQFADIYKEVMGVALTNKISIISDKNIEKLQKIIQEKWLQPKKKVVKKIVKKAVKKVVKKWDTAKVIKAWELPVATWFLSWMWFGGNQEEEVIVEEEVKPTEDKISVSKKDFDVIREQALASRKKRESTRPQWGAKPSFSRGKPHSRTPKKDMKKTEAVVPVKRIKKEATTSKNLVKKAEIVVDAQINVKEFSEKMWVSLPEVMKMLLKNKIMVSVNSSLDFDTASLIAEEFDVVLKKKEAKLNVESFLSGDLQAILDLDKEAEHLEERAPIVTVMGHVDHGKTTLLDYLRKTSVANSEAWGITQSIWASVVEHMGKNITFIDTPGHELFTSLRARWAKLTNVAVIVVAADDSVMPQTIESINHAKAANVPIIIAVTKIDKPGIHIDQIKNDLAAHGITPEDWGGDTPIIGVSGITGQWIPDLLEAILLQSEMLELKFNPKRSAIWVILDAYKDPKQWIVTSIIIMTGTLHLRDIVVAHNSFWKIRRMRDRKWDNVKEVSGWEPVQILWFTELPEPGRIVEIVKNEKEAMNKIAILHAQDNETEDTSILQEFLSQLKWWDSGEIPTLRLILKATGSSSLEALKQAVNGVLIPAKVEMKVIHTDVGHFTDSDLSLAQASKALVLWFGVWISNSIKKNAQWMGVDVKNFDIIYELTEYLENLLLGMVKIEQEEVVCGKLEVRGVFYRKWKQMVIGWLVTEWRVVNKAKFNVYRPGVSDDKDESEESAIFTTGIIESLQREQQVVKEVKESYECGMKVKVNQKIIEWDILEFLIMQDKVSDKKAESKIEKAAKIKADIEAKKIESELEAEIAKEQKREWLVEEDSKMKMGWKKAGKKWWKRAERKIKK